MAALPSRQAAPSGLRVALTSSQPLFRGAHGLREELRPPTANRGFSCSGSRSLGFLGFVAPVLGRRRRRVCRVGGTEEGVKEATLAIVGLGNVGSQFDGTRHNIGFAAVDEIAETLLGTDRWTLSGSIWQEAFGGRMLRLRRAGAGEPDEYAEILLFKPSSMMNGSGGPVSELVENLQIPESALVVIYDDLDLDVGRLRLRKSGSAGGQNGVKSILARGLQKFLRLRLGVSRPPKSGGRDAIVGHVLGRFRHEEQELCKEALGRAAVAVEELANGVSWDNVMNKFNRPMKEMIVSSAPR